MKKKVLVIQLLFLLVLVQANGQQIYFPRNIAADTTALKKFMQMMAVPLLAKLEATPKEKRDGEYYGSLYIIQTIAGRYKESIQSIDSVRVLFAKEGLLTQKDGRGYLFIYEAYDGIKLSQAVGDPRSEVEIFKSGLPIALKDLTRNAFTYATEPFAYTPASLEAEWLQTLTKAKARQTDSLSVDSAIMVSNAYLQYSVYKPFLSAGKQIITEFNNDNFVIQDSTMITMRDGVKLAAVIVRDRKITGPLPVVMMNNIYASTGEVNTAKEISGHGYVGVILNTRGKYFSDAAIEPWEHDAEDVYDAIDWISKQTWCNGKVGMFGGSYLGFSQWAAAKKLHPALKTIVPQVAAAPGIDFPMQNGIFATYPLRWLHYVTDNHQMTDDTGFVNMDHWNSSFNKWFKSGKAFNSLDSADGRPNAIFQKWLKHPSFDRYWQKMIPYKQEFGKINIPVLTITGYFDPEQFGALYYYKEHHYWNPAANHYLVIGPYDHSGAQGNPSAVVNGYSIDDAAKIDINKLVYDWFDFTLKGGKKPGLLKDTINYQVMGANEWAHVSSLKQLNKHSLKYYFSDVKDGKYFKLPFKKTLNSVEQQKDLSQRREYDLSGNNSRYSDSLNTKESLTFISGVLNNDMTIAGSFTARLSASVNKKDFDIVIGITVQQPDGKFFLLSYALQRASYSKNRELRILLKPGVKQFIPVTGTFVSKKILKGSRLIVQVGVLNSSGSEVNYGTGGVVENESIKDAKQPVQIKWYGDSLIQIPVTL